MKLQTVNGKDAIDKWLENKRTINNDHTFST